MVSADRAVQGEFLHYAKGLELEEQLAHVFFSTSATLRTLTHHTGNGYENYGHCDI